MKDLKNLRVYTIVIGMLIIVYGLISLIEISNIWEITSITAQININYSIYSTKDKIITTTYQILNIALILPIYQFYKICTIFNKGVYYNDEIINLLKKVSSLIYIVSAIAILISKFFKTTEGIENPIYWFNIHPVFFMFLGTIFSAFAVIFKEVLKQKQENELTI